MKAKFIAVVDIDIVNSFRTIDSVFDVCIAHPNGSIE